MRLWAKTGFHIARTASLGKSEAFWSREFASKCSPRRKRLFRIGSLLQQRTKATLKSIYRTALFASALALTVLSLLCWPQVVTAQANDSNEVLVGVEADQDLPVIADQLSKFGTILAHVSALHAYQLKLPLNTPVKSVLALIGQVPGIRYAEPNGYTGIATAPSNPNDTSYGLQYGLAKVNAISAWNIWQPRRRAVIAFTDTGISKTHPDLANMLFMMQTAWWNTTHSCIL